MQSFYQHSRCFSQRSRRNDFGAVKSSLADTQFWRRKRGTVAKRCRHDVRARANCALPAPRAAEPGLRAPASLLYRHRMHYIYEERNDACVEDLYSQRGLSAFVCHAWSPSHIGCSQSVLNAKPSQNILVLIGLSPNCRIRRLSISTTEYLPRNRDAPV